jgi:hypothetical protein
VKSQGNKQKQKWPTYATPTKLNNNQTLAFNIFHRIDPETVLPEPLDSESSQKMATAEECMIDGT